MAPKFHDVTNVSCYLLAVKICLCILCIYKSPCLEFLRWAVVKLALSAGCNLTVFTIAPCPQCHNTRPSSGLHPSVWNPWSLLSSLYVSIECLAGGKPMHCCMEPCIFHNLSSRRECMRDGLVSTVSWVSPFLLVSCRFSSLAASLCAVLPPLPVAWLSAPRAAWWKPNQVEKEQPWRGYQALQCSTSPPASRAGGATLGSHSWRRSASERALDETC